MVGSSNGEWPTFSGGKKLEGRPGQESVDNPGVEGRVVAKEGRERPPVLLTAVGYHPGEGKNSGDNNDDHNHPPSSGVVADIAWRVEFEGILDIYLCLPPAGEE